MSPIVVSAIVFACIFGGALLGMFFRAVLPDHHLSTETKDVVKLAMGLVATMAALVLGLLVASAKGSFDTQKSELTQMSANVILLDRVLAHYGPEAGEIRGLLRRAVAGALERFWPADSSRSPQVAPTSAGDVLYDAIQGLAPQSDAQRAYRAQALNMAISIGQMRWLLFEQSGSSIPVPFLVVLVLWLAILFASFGLFAPRNATVIVAMFVSTLSVSGALFLILELDQPFQGLIQIPSTQLRKALEQLGK